jgi:FtsP/CotA-like multicopper oxidase with cupredoxin domain
VIRAEAGGPGPTLHARRGEEMKVRFVNGLAEPSALHWRGVRIANAMDGVPGLTQQPVAPGASLDYRFVVPDAGTFCYGPPLTAGGKAMPGPRGALLVAEPGGVAADRDVLLFVDDTLEAPLARDIAVKANERLRLRLVNAGPARMLAVRIDRHPARVMAVDGQPAEPFPVRDARVVLAPGNRLDLFVDMVLNPGEEATILAGRGHAETPLARLVYAKDSAARSGILADPAPLPPNGLPAKMDFRAARRLDLPLDAAAAAAGPLFRVARGGTVMLGLVNRAERARAVHVHGHAFRLLDRLDDGWKPFWLDTTVVASRETARIAFVADNPGRWAIDIQEIDFPNNAIQRFFEVM